MSDEKIIPIKGRSEDEKIGEVKGLGFADITGGDLESGLWSQEIKAFMENSTLKGLFYHEDWVFLIVDLLSDFISRSRLKVMEKEIVKGKEVTRPVDDHFVNAVLDMPNELHEYDSWMYLYCVEYLLMGNVIEFRAKAANQLIIIPAESAMLDFDDKGKLSEYVITDAGQSAFEGQLPVGMALKAKEIWHQRRPNPQSMLWGLSPFIPNRKSILFNRYTQDYLNSFYLKGATPGLALKMEKNVAEDSALRFLRSFEVAHTGRRNQRRTLVLPKGVDVQVLTPSLGDQKLVEMINNNREKIINILRIPKHALSLAETGSLGSEEAKVALRFFYTSAVIPNQNKIAAFLTRRFMGEGSLEPDQFLQFDNSEVEVLADDLMKKAELGEKLKGQWTPNEIRESVWDMEAADGGDVLETQSNLQAVKVGTEVAGEEVIEDSEDEEQTGDLEAQEESLEEWIDPATKEMEDIRNKFYQEKYGEWLTKSQKQISDIIEDPQNDFTEVVLDTLASHAETAVKIIKEELEKLPKRVKGLGDKPSKLPRAKTLRRKLTQAFNKKTNESFGKGYEELFDIVESGFDTQLDLVFDKEARDEIETLRGESVKGRRDILEARGISTFKNISKTSTNKVLNQISDGIKKQKTIDQIAKGVAENFKNVSPSRAKTIVRTETLTAVSIGKQAALESAVKVLPTIKKVWINANDDRVRGQDNDKNWEAGDPDHIVLQGETVNPKDEFSNGLRYPRDVKAAIEETINCRCDMLMIPAEDIPDLG